MQDSTGEREEDERMPTKKVRALEPEGQAELEIEDPVDRMMESQTQGSPDVAMEEEKTQDEDMTLGQVIFRISHSDPIMNRWAERINSTSRGERRRNSPAPVGGVGAAWSGAGISHPVQADVSEIYSPPRVTVMAAKTGLNAGSAMDLRTGYDFSKKEDQERARQQIKEERPRLLVGSPECRMFSTQQQLSPWTIEKARKLLDAKAHMKFVCDLYREQIEEGRWILHEHPVGATSWKMEVMMNILKMGGVSTVVWGSVPIWVEDQRDSGHIGTC